MTFTIPMWMLYVIGGVAALVLLLLAAVGVVLLLFMRDTLRDFGRAFGW